MAELFKLRVESGKIAIPPRLARRLNIKISDAIPGVTGEHMQEGAEFEVMINDDKTLVIKAVQEKVIFTPSDSELAEYNALEKNMKSSEDFADVLKRIQDSLTTVQTSSAASA